MAHITIQEFKDLPLGLKDSHFAKIGDTGLQAFIDTASTQVDNFCGRQLASGTVVEAIDGNGAMVMLLREYPVTALTSVAWEDETGQTGTEDVAIELTLPSPSITPIDAPSP